MPDSLKTTIRRGDYVNLQLLLVDNDDDNMYEQQHQRLTLQVGRQDTLSLLKPSTNKASKTIDQWVTAFTIYGAVLTETSPNLAPGIFKHIADITEMARRFGSLAWYHYDESTCLHSLLSFERLADDIGIPLNTGKRRPPSTCQVVYGIEIDTTTMELRLPADKLAKALSLVNRMSNCRKGMLRDLLSLIGLLSYCCLVVSHAS